MLKTIWSLVGRLVRYIVFVAKNFRAVYGVLALTAVVLALEYLATSLMIPMAPGQNGMSSAVGLFWTRVAEFMGLDLVLRTWLWLFFVLMIVRLSLGYVLGVMTTWLGKEVHRVLSGRVFGHILQHEPMVKVYARSVGHYITMAGDDTFKSGTIISSLLQATVGMATALVGLVVLFQFSQIVFFSVVVFLLLSMAVVLVLMRQVVRLNNKAVSLSRDLSTSFVEAINSLRSLRALQGARFVSGAYAKDMKNYVGVLVEMDAIKTGVKAFPAVALLLIAAVILRPGAEVAMADSALFAGTVIIIRVFASLGQMATAGSQMLTDIRAVNDIDALVNIAQDINSTGVAFQVDRVRKVLLDNISFGYGDRGHVLKGVNFQFDAGHTYAVVGPSGSGKSTLADLLLGLSSPSSGSIVVNGGAHTLCDAKSRFMLVEQQPKVFSSTIRENLLMGAPASEKDLYAALEVVNLAATVHSLPEGLDTRVTYLGENFSGGQRQRLGIARALLRAPDVLILDEATSALDPVTRTVVVKKLREHMQGGIIIFITHDPEIAALADKVLPIGDSQAVAVTSNGTY